jgi:hypothetical protein
MAAKTIQDLIAAIVALRSRDTATHEYSRTGLITWCFKMTYDSEDEMNVNISESEMKYQEISVDEADSNGRMQTQSLNFLISV